MVHPNQILRCFWCGGYHYPEDCQSGNPYAYPGNQEELEKPEVDEEIVVPTRENELTCENREFLSNRKNPADGFPLPADGFAPEQILDEDPIKSSTVSIDLDSYPSTGFLTRREFFSILGIDDVDNASLELNAKSSSKDTLITKTTTPPELDRDNRTKAESSYTLPSNTEKKHDVQVSNFLDVFKKLHTNMPFIDSLLQMLKYAKFLKQFLATKEKIEELETVALTAECSAIMQKNVPRKSRDPGSFSIPCTIGNVTFDRALCDLGSSINLMPSSICRKLGLGDCNPTKVTLQMADRSIRHPRGTIENVLVKVDKLIFPADFVVLDMEEDDDVPIILGRPFLATGRASIDVAEGKLSLRVGDDEVSFNMFNSPKSTNNIDACSSSKQEESSKQDLSMLGEANLGLEEKQEKSTSLPSKSGSPCKEKNSTSFPLGTIRSLIGSKKKGKFQATSEKKREESPFHLGETFIGSILQEHEEEESVTTSCFAFNSNSHDSKKKTKAWYTNREAMKKEFPKGAKVMLRNDTRWKLFPEKEKKEWSGPFIVCRVVSNGAVEIKDSERKFLMTGLRLKLCDDGGGSSSHAIPFGT